MKEVGDDFSDCLFVVDESFEDFGLAVCRDDVIIGDGGWHETGVAFWDVYFIAGASYPYLAVTIEYHHYDEGVVLDHVAMERLGSLYHLDAEVWSVEYLVGYSEVFLVIGTVFGIYVVVNGL